MNAHRHAVPDPDDSDEPSDVLFARVMDVLPAHIREALTRPRPADSAASAAPAAGAATPTDAGPIRPGAAVPDGPNPRFVFAYTGRAVDFGRAPYRYRLLEALWEPAAPGPHPERDIGDVIEHVWGAEETPGGGKGDDRPFRDLCYQVRKAFREAGVLLTVRVRAGRVWLERLP